MAKKYNKGRRQKRNLDKYKLEKYREEIAREMGVSSKNLPMGDSSKNLTGEKETESRKKRNGPYY